MRYSVSKNGVTLKTRLGHWKWHHLIDRIRVHIRLSNYGDIFYRLRDIATYYRSPQTVRLVVSIHCPLRAKYARHEQGFTVPTEKGVWIGGGAVSRLQKKKTFIRKQRVWCTFRTVLVSHRPVKTRSRLNTSERTTSAVSLSQHFNYSTGEITVGYFYSKYRRSHSRRPCLRIVRVCVLKTTVIDV